MALLIAAIGQAPASPSALQPTAPWGAFDEGYRCTIERTFGAKPGDMAMKLALDPFGRAEIDLLIRSRLVSGKPEALTIGFDGTDALATWARISHFPRHGVVFVRATVDDAEQFWRLFNSSRQMRVLLDGKESVRVGYANPRAAYSQAEKCRAGIFARYGAVAAATPAKLVTKGKLIFDSEYPAEAINAGRAGTSMAYVTVGTDGSVADCATARSSGTAVLDKAACVAIRRRGRFEPGRDAAGRPVPVIWPFRVAWRMEDDDSLLDSIFASGFLGAGQPGGVVN